MSIQTLTMTTKNGNILSFFYNSDNDLLTVDLIHKSGKAGSELVRKTLDEAKSLAHVKELIDNEVAMNKLEQEYDTISQSSEPLHKRTESDLRTLLAWHAHSDGAPWGHVCEIKQGDLYTKEEVIQQLEDTFGL